MIAYTMYMYNLSRQIPEKVNELFSFYLALFHLIILCYLTFLSNLILSIFFIISYVISHFTDHRCWWMWNLLNTEEGSEPYNFAMATFEAAQVDFISLATITAGMETYVEKISNDLLVSIKPSLSLAQQYLAGNVTKLQLSEALTDFELTKALEDILSSKIKLVDFAKLFSSSATSLKLSLQLAYKKLLKADPPVLKPSNLQHFQLMQHAKKATDVHLNLLWDTVSTNMVLRMDEIISRIIQVSFVVLSHNIFLINNSMPKLNIS